MVTRYTPLISLVIQSNTTNFDLTPVFQLSQGIEEVVVQNIQAVSELSDLVQTSFGPNGAQNDSSDQQ